MRYAGTRRSEHIPLRSISVFQAASLIQSSTDADWLAGHPDAALLILCGELRTLQEEWQHLWAATPEAGEPGPADDAWRDYSNHVWPGVSRQGADCDGDLVRTLISSKATTFDGMRAKAAAIKALDDAGGYLMSIHDDSYELMLSLLHDVADPAAMTIGEDADPIATVAAE